MGLVDLGELPPLCEELDDPDDSDRQELSPRQERLARLAGAGVAGGDGDSITRPRALPLLLALPEAHPETRHAIGPEMLGDPGDADRAALRPGAQPDLCARSRGRVRRARRRARPARRPRRRARPAPGGPLVLVGAVDSYLDSRVALCARRRRAAQDRRDRRRLRPRRRGRVPAARARPGSAARTGRQPIARITGVGRAREAGHLYSAEPNRGDGLAAAFGALFERAGERRGDAATSRCVYAGLNGESYWAKEWGVAQIRCAGRLRERLRVRASCRLLRRRRRGAGPDHARPGRDGALAGAHRRRLPGVGRRRSRRARRGAARALSGHGAADTGWDARRRRRVISLGGS